MLRKYFEDLINKLLKVGLDPLEALLLIKLKVKNICFFSINIKAMSMLYILPYFMDSFSDCVMFQGLSNNGLAVMRVYYVVRLNFN